MSRFSVRDIAVLLAALTALLIPIIITEINVLQHTKGVISYPADDAFINMTVARNLAFDKVWGISKYSFQSVSVAPLYVLILAVIYFIFGQDLFIPLLINALMAFAFLVLVQRWMVRRSIGTVAQVILLLLVIFCASLPSLVISGKEYMLQVLLTFLFVSSFIDFRPDRRGSRLVYIYGGLMVMSGYTVSIVAMAACGVLCWRRQWRAAVALAAAAFVPLVLLGVLSLSKGGYFLPNPMMLQGTVPVHRWAFLFANSVLFGGTALSKYWPAIVGKRGISVRWGIALILTLLIAPVYFHSSSSLADSTKGCIEVYQHEYPVAKFVHRYYDRRGIALDDAGMISYWSQGRKLDLSGMADWNVLKCRREHIWSPLVVDSLSNNDYARIGVFSREKYFYELSAKWSKVVSWTFAPNHVGRDSVVFFTADTSLIRNLRRDLLDFQPSLPATILVRYY